MFCSEVKAMVAWHESATVRAIWVASKSVGLNPPETELQPRKEVHTESCIVWVLPSADRLLTFHHGLFFLERERDLINF